MCELIKVRDISLKYNVSTRALKYYEDMGLIQSTHIEGYAYRCYDSQAVTRLEQVLILRKLDISIKDIMRIFASNGAGVLLEVLHRKADDINEQIFLLSDLKRFVLDFINSTNNYEFNDQDDIKRLYNKARAMEEHLDSVSASKFMEISKKLEKAPVVSVVELPAIPMARCGEEESDAFESWWRDLEKQIKPLHSGNLNWFNFITERVAGLYALPYGWSGNCPYEVFDFPGGLYATATFLDDPYPYAFEINTSYLYKWVAKSNDYELYLSEDRSQERFVMWRNKPSLGKEQPQIEFYVPIVRKCKEQKIYTEGIAADKLLGTIKTCHPINLRTLKRLGEIDMKFSEDGLQICQQGHEGYCRTQENFCLPLRIDMTVKTDSSNIRLSYHKAVVVFNWSVAPNSMLIRDVMTGELYRIDGIGYVPPNEYVKITWTIAKDYMAVIVGGQVRMIRHDMPYTRQMVADSAHCVRLHTAFGATMTVQQLEISELEKIN